MTAMMDVELPTNGIMPDGSPCSDLMMDKRHDMPPGAEQLGRRCFGIELKPRYVDVVVARWEKFTGKKAVLSA